MADVVKTTKVLMKQGDGGEFPINVGALQDSEVPSIVESLETSKVWGYYNHSLTYEDSTYGSDAFVLPTVPKDLATKHAKFMELQIFNDKGQSFFIKVKGHLPKSGVTTELNAMITALNTKTLGSFGKVTDVVYEVSK